MADNVMTPGICWFCMRKPIFVQITNYINEFSSLWGTIHSHPG